MQIVMQLIQDVNKSWLSFQYSIYEVKLVPKVVDFVLKKEPLKSNETALEP